MPARSIDNQLLVRPDGPTSAVKRSLLDGIGLVVVVLAVFDVAKYLME